MKKQNLQKKFCSCFLRFFYLGLCVNVCVVVCMYVVWTLWIKKDLKRKHKRCRFNSSRKKQRPGIGKKKKKLLSYSFLTISWFWGLQASARQAFAGAFVARGQQASFRSACFAFVPFSQIWTNGRSGVHPVYIFSLGLLTMGGIFLIQEVWTR